MLVPVPVPTSGALSSGMSLTPDSAQTQGLSSNQHSMAPPAHYNVIPGQPFTPYFMHQPPLTQGFAASSHQAAALHASQAAAAAAHHAYGLPGYAQAPGIAMGMHMPPHAYGSMHPQQFPFHGAAVHGYHPMPGHMQAVDSSSAAAHAIALATAGKPPAYIPGTAPAIGSVLTEFPVQKPGPALQFGSDPQGPHGANLFIFHLPNDMTNMDLLHYFAPFGTVVSARIIVDRATGRSRGFGFVSYSRPEFAVAAIQRLDGMRIGHKRLKVTFKHEKGSGGGGSKAQPQTDQAEPERNDPAPEVYAGAPFPQGVAAGGHAVEHIAPASGHSDVDPTVSLASHGRAGSPPGATGHVHGPPGGEHSAAVGPSEATPATTGSAALPRTQAAQGGRDRRKRSSRKHGSSHASNYKAS